MPSPQGGYVAPEVCRRPAFPAVSVHAFARLRPARSPASANIATAGHVASATTGCIATSDFYTATTGASDAFRLSRRTGNAISHEVAVALVRRLCRFPVQPMTTAVMHGAFAVRLRTGYSYWDSAIIAAASALGCTEVLTEDMHHGQRIAGVRITNPFR